MLKILIIEKDKNTKTRLLKHLILLERQKLELWNYNFVNGHSTDGGESTT